MNFWYNFPSGAWLGSTAGLALTVAAGRSLWYGGGKSDSRRTSLLTTCAILVLAGSTHLGLIQEEFGDSRLRDLPETAGWALLATWLAVALLAYLAVGAIRNRRAVETSGLVLGTLATFTLASDVALMRLFEDGWALAVTAGWLLTMGAFVVAIGVQLHAYGQRCYERGVRKGTEFPIDTARMHG